MTLVGGTIWYLPRHYIDRSEKELDDLERLHFNSVVTGYLNRLMSSAAESYSEGRASTSPQISFNNLNRIAKIFSNREEFKGARKDIDDLKDVIFKNYFFSLLLLLASLITYYLLPEENDLLVFELLVLAILFFNLLLNLWDYRTALIELRDKAIKFNKDVMIEESTQTT
jgi:hypothetical protein